MAKRISRTLPTVVLVAVGSLVAAGCGSSGSAGKTAGATIAAANLPAVADIDPKAASDSNESQLMAVNVAGTLFSHVGSKQSPDSAATIPDPVPDLATAATPSSDGLTWTFTLRKGVKSQDGNPLTPADVVWTIKRAFHTGQSGANLLTGMHVDPQNPATAVGADAVALHLTAPSSLVEKTMAISFLGIIDAKAVAKHSPSSDPWGYKYLAKHSATFGPYQVSDAELPTKEVLVANPHYWRGKPAIAKATYVSINDDSTRLATVLSGQADYGTTLSVSDAAKIKSSSAAQLDLQSNVFLEFYLVFEQQDPLARNLAFRRAVSAAVDRQQIGKTAYSGLANAVTSCVPTGLYKAPADLATFHSATADATKAKALLASSPVSKPVTIGYPTAIPNAESLMEVVRTNLQAAGMKVTLKPYSSYTTFLADQKAGKFPIGLNGFGANVVDPGYFLYTIASSASSYNLGAYKNPAYDTAAAKTMSTNGAEHEQALAASCRLALEDVPVAPLVSVDNIGAASKKFTRLSSLGGQPLLYNMTMSG